MLFNPSPSFSLLSIMRCNSYWKPTATISVFKYGSPMPLDLCHDSRVDSSLKNWYFCLIFSGIREDKRFDNIWGASGSVTGGP